MEPSITSMQNPKVMMWRSLGKRQARRAHCLFLIEGPRMVQEALAAELQTECVIVEMGMNMAFEGILAKATCEVFPVSPHIFKAVCDTKTPQGIAAVVRLPQQTLLEKMGRLVIALDPSITPVSRAIAHLAAQTELLDVSVSDISAEEMVAALYKEYEI